MTNTKRNAHAPDPGEEHNKGLFRAILAGPGYTLADAFANLERAPNVERVVHHPKRDLLGARIALPIEEGKGYWDFTRVRDEFYVVVENFAYKDPRIELVPGDGQLQFNFRLSGDLTVAVSRTAPLRLVRPSLLVWNQPSGIELREWTAPSAHERSVAISMRPEFFREHFFISTDAIPEPLRAFMRGDSGKINYCQLPLSAQMFEIAMELVDNPFDGSGGLIYTEALALQLLLYAVKGFSSISTGANEQYTQRELQCLNAARQFLMRQFAPVPNIKQIARVAGINEVTLKKGFKTVFGETPFEFGIRCRMQHAIVLLRDQRMPVARVAEAVGYGHQTSFATAFLRQFGMRPKDVRPSKHR